MRCNAITSRAGEPRRQCRNAAAWHVPQGLQVVEQWLCDDHRAAFVEAASTFCSPDGWKWPEPMDNQQPGIPAKE
jgi:hypothetical protein